MAPALGSATERGEGRGRTENRALSAWHAGLVPGPHPAIMQHSFPGTVRAASPWCPGGWLLTRGPRLGPGTEEGGREVFVQGCRCWPAPWSRPCRPPAGTCSGQSGGSTPASSGPAWTGPSAWCWSTSASAGPTGYPSTMRYGSHLGADPGPGEDCAGPAGRVSAAGPLGDLPALRRVLEAPLQHRGNGPGWSSKP